MQRARLLLRPFAYLHGGTGGKMVQPVIDPFKFRELRPKPDKYRIYKPKKLLEFDNDGVMLIYSYKHSWTATLSEFMKKFIPVVTTCTLLITNPWPCYYSFQTCKSLMNLALTVHEVRLKNDGLHIEISMLNWFGQVWDHNRYTMNIADLMAPPLYPDSLPLDGDHFPVSTEIFEIESDNKKPWVKFSDVVRRKHFIPKNYDYIDRELMVAVMNGFYIDISNT